QHALLAARWKLPTLKRVRTAQVKATAPFFVPGVNAHVGHKQIQQTVPVEIKERRAGGMSRALRRQAGRRGDVLEPSAPKVFEQNVAHAHGGHEEIRLAVVVDVRKGCGHANLVGQADARGGRDILELAMTQIAPELAGSQLIDEINIEPAV